MAVTKWIKREVDLLLAPAVSSSIQEVSFDEMWHFANKKKKNYGSGRQWSAFKIPPLAGVSEIILLQYSESFSKSLST